MENNESVILDVKLDAAKVSQDLSDMVARIAALKAQQADLTKEIKAGNDENGKYAEQLIRVKDQLGWCEKQAKGLSATTKLLTADTQTYSDSLNGQRQKLADMQKAYDQLDAAARNSEGGKQFLEAIKAQHDAVLGLEEETGRMQRNVGNYPKAFTAAIPGFDKATAAMSKMGLSIDKLGEGGAKSFATLGQSAKAFGKAMITPPVGIIVVTVSAIVAIIGKLVEAFKRNDDAMTSLQRAFSAFQPIITAVGKAFDVLAKGIATAVEWTAKMASKLVGALVPAYKEAAAAADQLVVAQDKLEDTEREYTVNSAKRSRDIARLRAESTESKDLATREAKLKEAMALEEQDLMDRKKITAEKLRLLESEARKNNDTSDEMKNKIAEARAAMYSAEEAYYTGTKKLQSELNSVQQAAIREEEEKRKAAQAEAKRAAEERARQAKEAAAERKRQAEEARRAREQAAKEAQAFAKAQAQATKEVQQQAEDFALALIEDEVAKSIATRKLQGEREIAELQNRLNTDKTLTAAAKAQLAELIKGKQAQLDAELLQMVDDAAKAKSDAEYAAEQARAARILEYKLQLAEEGSQVELELQKAQLDLQMQQALEAENLTEEEKYLIRQTFQQKAMELDKEYNDNLVKTAEDAKKQYKASLQNTAQQASQTFSAMSSLLAAYGEENEDAAKASKAFGIASIVTDQAVSIANTAKAITEAVSGATAAAAAGGPAAPFLLAGYIAAMVGAVLGAVAGVASSIQSAKQLLSQDAGKFEGGGVIKGNSTSGDKLIAHVNSNEVISNPRQAANLLYEISNNPARGGYDYGEMAEAIAAANANLPAPVMNYAEFEEFNQKRATYNEFASI